MPFPLKTGCSAAIYHNGHRRTAGRLPFDMTRTVALGAVSEEQRAVYDTVLKAHLAVLDAVKPGLPCNEADRIARDIIEKDYPGPSGMVWDTA